MIVKEGEGFPGDRFFPVVDFVGHGCSSDILGTDEENFQSSDPCVIRCSGRWSGLSMARTVDGQTTQRSRRSPHETPRRPPVARIRLSSRVREACSARGLSMAGPSRQVREACSARGTRRGSVGRRSAHPVPGGSRVQRSSAVPGGGWAQMTGLGEPEPQADIHLKQLLTNARPASGVSLLRMREP